MSDWNDREQDKEQQEIVIQDRRHGRSDDERTEAPVEPEAGPEPPPQPVAEPPAEPEPVASGEVVEFQKPSRPPEAPVLEEAAPSESPEPESAEQAQMKMLFEIGINGYLHGQIQLLLTFALIYLGRQPNPATGLVTSDLDKAGVAIDLLEFIATRTLSDLPETEQVSLRQLVGELKMVFAQTAQEAAPAASTEPPGK